MPCSDLSPPSGTWATKTFNPARSALAHNGSARNRLLLNAALLSVIVDWLCGVRGMRLPLMPVVRGGAPVHKDAKPGAVFEGKTGKTLSANAPPSISLARLGNLP